MMTGTPRAALLAAILFGAFASAAQAQLELKPATAQGAAVAAPDWKTVTEFEKVDFTGLTDAQKELVLKVMRTEGCDCGCAMKIAECRIRDTNCGKSPVLAGQVVAAVKAGKSEADVVAALKTTVAKPGTLAEEVEIPIDGAPFKGPKDAKVTIVEFSDFECPFCSKAVKWAEDVLAAYPKDVKLVFKQFPLPMHRNAKLAALASLAADKQGKFWPMHDKLFAEYRSLSRTNVELWAKEMGLDMTKFTAALDSEELAKVVDKDIADGQAVGVRGTPSFFVNGRRYSGARQDASSIKPLIDEILNGDKAATEPAKG